MPSRRLAVAAALAAAGTVLVTAPAAPAARKVCSSQDLRYPFRAGGPKTFGVFALTISGGSCATARRVAKAFKTTYEASGKADPPTRVAGYTFRTLPAKAAQEYREQGTRGGVTVRFSYRVPNG